ncbi:hypothetical protein XI07_04685 [Bradyrhizobium sp. CCBAU 11445]|nr:hypothetical protein [Bradyrhizobium sp. CCBAU 11445]MDA9521856.1 hypothetical protein [Bradyrhizobium sp. CCBAU 11434]
MRGIAFRGTTIVVMLERGCKSVGFWGRIRADQGGEIASRDRTCGLSEGGALDFVATLQAADKAFKSRGRMRQCPFVPVP